MKFINLDDKTYKIISKYKNKSETYNDVIKRLYDEAIEVQFSKLFLNTKDTIDIKELKW
jgi:predicted CopG family antitoxin